MDGMLCELGKQKDVDMNEVVLPTREQVQEAVARWVARENALSMARWPHCPNTLSLAVRRG